MKIILRQNADVRQDEGFLSLAGLFLRGNEAEIAEKPRSLDNSLREFPIERIFMKNGHHLCRIMVGVGFQVGWIFWNRKNPMQYPPSPLYPSCPNLLASPPPPLTPPPAARHPSSTPSTGHYHTPSAWSLCPSPANLVPLKFPFSRFVKMTGPKKLILVRRR